MNDLLGMLGLSMTTAYPGQIWVQQQVQQALMNTPYYYQYQHYQPQQVEVVPISDETDPLVRLSRRVTEVCAKGVLS
jgi:hypothetical protein